MTSSLGTATVTVEGDGSGFTDELDAQINSALVSVVAAAAAAMSQIESEAAAGGAAVGDQVREGAEAAAAALNNIDSSNLDQVRARAAQMGAALQDARQRETQAANMARDAEIDLRRALANNETTTDQLREATQRHEQAQDLSTRASANAEEALRRQRTIQDQLNDSQQEGADVAGELGSGFGEMAGSLAGAAAGIAGLAVGIDTVFESFDRMDMGNKLAAQLDLTAAESEQAGKLAGKLYAENYGESVQEVTDAIGAMHSSLSNLTDSPAEMEALTKAGLTLASTFEVDVAEAANTANIMIRNGLAKDGVEAFDLLGAAMQRVPAQMRDELIPIIDEYSTYLHSMGFTGQEAMGLIVNASQEGAIGMDKVGDAIKEFGIRATDLGDKGAVEAMQAIGLEADVMSNDLLAGGDVAQRAFQEIVDGLLKIENPAEQAAAATALFGTPLEDLDKAKIPGFLRGLSDAGTGMGEFAGTVDEMGNTLSQGPGAKLETFKRQLQDTFINVMGTTTGYLDEHRGVLYTLGGVMAAVVVGYLGIRTAAVVSSIATGINTVATGANTAALAGNKIALGAAAIASGVMKGAQLAGAVATGIATAATWAFNTAMAVLTSPIFLIIAAIALLVGGLVWFFTKTELGKKIIGEVWEFIQTAISFAWNEVIKPVFDGFMNVIQWLGDKAMWLWAEVISPVFGWIGDLIGFVIDGVMLYFRLWGAVFEVVGTALQMLWDNFLWPILTWIGDKFSWLWNEIISPVIGWIVGKFDEMKLAFSLLWSEVILPVAGWIGDKFSWLYNEVIAPVAGWIGDRLGDIGGFFSGLWDKVLQVAGWIMGKLGEVTDFFGGIKDKIFGALGDAGRMLWDWGVNLIQGLLDGAGSLLSKIGDFFLDKIPGWIKDPFKKAMGINSPSKVFMDYGVNLGEGLIGGVESMSDQVKSATQSMADAAGDVSMPALNGPALPAEFGAAAAAALPVPAGLPATPVAPVPMPDLAAAVPGVDALGEGLTAAKDGVIDPAVLGMQTNLDTYAATFPAVTDGTILPAMTNLGVGMTAAKDTLIDPALWGMQGNMAWTGQLTADTVNGVVLPSMNAMGAGIMGVKVGTIDPAFAGIQGGLQNVQGAFATGVSAISSQWDQMRGAVARPVRFAIDTVFNDGLVGMWNSVSDLIGTPKMNPYVVGGFAAGTSLLPGYSPGRDNMRFTTADGSTAIDLSGGEAIMRPEFGRALGPAAVDGINRAAALGGPNAVRNFIGSFAGGGIVGNLTDIVQSRFPGMQMTSGYRAGDPGHHGTGNAADFSDGFDDTPAMQSLSHWWADNFKASTLELIHAPFNRNIKNGEFVGDGNSFYGADTMAAHRNHVHIAVAGMLNADGTGNPIAMGAGGSSFNMAEYIGQKTKPMADAIAANIAGFQGAGMMGELPSKVYDSMSTAMNAKITEAAAKAAAAGLGTSMGPLGEGAMFYAKEIVEAAKERALGKDGAAIGVATSIVETGLRMYANHAVPESLSFPHDAVGSDHDSVGLFQQRQAGWGTLAERMNPRASAGLFFNKLMQFDWRSMDPGAAAQRVQVSAFPAKYGEQMGTARGIVDQVFDGGGEAWGKGFLAKDIVDPERMLSPEQTRSFNNLVDGLMNLGDGSVSIGGLTLSANGDLSINEGNLPRPGTGPGGPANGTTTVHVTQVITGKDAVEIAERVSTSLLELLP